MTRERDPDVDNADLDEDDALTEAWICQGPPRCDLSGNAAVAAQMGGCPWCRVVYTHPDGSESVREPSTA